MKNSTNTNDKLRSYKLPYLRGSIDLINYAVHKFHLTEIEKVWSDDEPMAKWYVDRLQNTLIEKQQKQPYSTYADCFFDFFLYLDQDGQEKLLEHIHGVAHTIPTSLNEMYEEAKYYRVS
tara:strand:+ start:8210 stop:8569 length:360 start_codon:yes stop_codon:yes gene_type:complete